MTDGIKMNTPYNKAMIELVYEIRRRIDSELKPDIKFANPNLLRDLSNYYQLCQDTILKALIKELMMYAGKAWEESLSQESPIAKQQHVVKSYRGVISVEAVAAKDPIETSPLPKPTKPELIYRGQVVR